MLCYKVCEVVKDKKFSIDSSKYFKKLIIPLLHFAFNSAEGFEIQNSTKIVFHLSESFCILLVLAR